MLPREFAELVEEEDAAMREADLARLSESAAATNQAGSRDAVVRRAKRGPQRGGRAFAERASKRVDRRHLERGVEPEVRQERRERPSQHGLAGTGRARHQQVVPSGRGDLERALRLALAANSSEVRLEFGLGTCGLPIHRGQESLAAEVLDTRLQRSNLDDLPTCAQSLLGSRPIRKQT